jgi:MipA family protein
MYDLDWLGEAGPRLSVPLWNLGGHGRIKFFLPWRGVFSTNGSNFHTRGATLTPSLYIRYLNALRPEWIWISEITGEFGNRPLNAYFYDVAPAYATPQRSFYDARAGYLGTNLFTGLFVPLKNRRFRVFAGISVSLHQGSANMDSPLFRRQVNMTGIGGIAWELFESKIPSSVYVP